MQRRLASYAKAFSLPRLGTFCCLFCVSRRPVFLRSLNGHDLGSRKTYKNPTFGSAAQGPPLHATTIRKCTVVDYAHARSHAATQKANYKSKWCNIWIRDVFCAQHLCYWGKNTSRIQHKKVLNYVLFRRKAGRHHVLACLPW